MNPALKTDLGAAPTRMRIDGRLPQGLGWGVALLALIVVLLVAPKYWVFIINLTLIASVGALGLNLLTGSAGQVSVGNAAFLAIGGFTAVAVAPKVGFGLAILAGALAAGAAGVLVGLPALRLRGLYLAISTLALLFIVQFGFEKVQEKTDAVAGYNLPSAQIGPWQIVTDQQWSVVLVMALMLTVFICLCLVNSRPGRAWAAVREHDVAAAIVGIDVRASKLYAFLISSILIGAAGVLRAFYISHISYEEFSLDLTVAYVAMIIIGGMGSIPGSLIGAAIVTMLPFVIQNIGTSIITDPRQAALLFKNLSLIEEAAFGVLVLGFLMFEPRGLAALFGRLGSTVRRLAQRRTGHRRIART